MRKNLKAPIHIDLVEVYLSVHFAGKPAAVFCDPMNHQDAIVKILAIPFQKQVDLCSGDIYVHRMPVTRVNDFVNRLDEAKYGYVLAWDGRQFTTENT